MFEIDIWTNCFFKIILGLDTSCFSYDGLCCNFGSFSCIDGSSRFWRSPNALEW